MYQLKPFSGQKQWQVSVESEVQAHAINLSYKVISPDIKNLILTPPKANSIRRQNHLWQSTCFELFIKKPDLKKYFEFNFSPFKAFQGYAFTDYRADQTELLALNSAKINSCCRANIFMLNVQFTVQDCIQLKDYELFPSAVLQHRLIGPSYWAVEHHKKVPDFHFFK